MSRVLEDARIKLVRAQEHLDDLERRVKPTIKSEPFEMYAEPNLAQPKELILRVRIVNPPDPYWGAIIGDIAQNCRAALEYIAEALGIENGYFPLYDDTGKFLREAIPKLTRLDPSHVALIEAAQPCHGTIRPVTNHPGSVLRVISNADKHRVLTTVLMGQESLEMILTVNGQEVHRTMTIEARVLEDHAEVTRLNIAEFAPHDVDVHTRLKSRVYVEGKWPLVLATLGILRYVRDDVLARFEPILRRL